MQFFFIYCGGIFQLVTSIAIIKNSLNYKSFPDTARQLTSPGALSLTSCDTTDKRLPSKMHKTFRVMNATLHWTSSSKLFWCCFWPWHWNESENFTFFHACKPTCLHSLKHKRESTQSYVKFKYTNFILCSFNCLFLVSEIIKKTPKTRRSRCTLFAIAQTKRVM